MPGMKSYPKPVSKSAAPISASTLSRAALLALAGAALPIHAARADTSDPACAPTTSSIGWTSPKNVSIASDQAVRWPIDASIRVAFSGPWCPDPDTIALVDKRTMEAIPAQIRVRVPQTLFHNEPAPLSVIEIDPIDDLEKSADYTVTVKPAMPSLQMYAEFSFDFRAARRAMTPWPADFEGASAVAPMRPQQDCWGQKIFAFSDADQMRNLPCMRDRRLELTVDYQPLDRPEAIYAIYRTHSIPLDEAGMPMPDDPSYDDQRTLLSYEAGSSDQGSGVPTRHSAVTVPYEILPRRECFSVMLVDEWGRERGDATKESCLDIPLLTPCPKPAGGEQQYPEPNPFDLHTPADNPACEEVCLNGADCASHTPPPIDDTPPTGDAGAGGTSGGDGGTGGAGGSSGDGGPATDGGPNTGDGGPAASGGGGGGCAVMPGHAAPSLHLALSALTALSGLIGVSRRRRARA